MCNIGYKGWVSINLGDKNFIEPLKMTFNVSAPIATLAFNEAAAMTAKLIATEYDNLHLLLSGGMDSEFVAKTFINNDVKFTPVIVKLQGNSAESWYAYKFCAENNLTPLILDFSDDASFSSFTEMILNKSKQLNVKSVIGVIPNVVASMFPDISIVTGFGEPFFNSKSYTESMGERYEICDHDFYLESEFNGQHPGAFFTYTPELFTALIRDIDYTLNTQEAKAKLYAIMPRAKMHVPVLTGTLPNHIKYAAEKHMAKYLSLPTDRFLQILSKAELVSQLSGLSASSRFTNSAAYAKINIGE